MKKSEFKQIIKPIVSECIKESLMDGGLISGIIAEVVKGIAVTAPIVENTTPPTDPAIDRLKRNAFNNEQTATLKEHKSKLMAAIGGNAYNGVNLFEGTSPAPAQQSPTQQASPLAGQAPADPGVDISNLFSTVGRSWNAHMDDVKGGK